ncbi:hypothetical protein [Mucilaginibacter pedocola]|uniref:Uncharacterized protein n=1 Tax=Mucilaginibacter pedocola TaxID=1792845 RepID=A0A1S9PIS9_9SPHI|nr:hypothetical protein [Mucilaginibacter pedocola]OOQ60837.1 hypothetical protein BC343_22995 [Mucilaginibacter pedocola]
MDIVYIINQIKYDILTVGGKPAIRAYNLLSDTPLYSIGYDESELCRELEYKLQLVADEYHTGRSISYGAVSKNFTVRQCIELVIV